MCVREISELAAEAMETLRRIERHAPRVHCLTNTVAQPITANALLAVGAVPSLTADTEEMPEMIRSADALLINLGTPAADSVAIHSLAAGTARTAGLPWVLDPVMADRSAARLARAHALLDLGPTAVRCNAGEAEVLRDRIDRARILAVTGATDSVRQGERTARITAGHPLATRVTATGCALSALTAAAIAARRDDPFAAMLHALAIFGAANAVAASKAAGTGSFAVALLDALSALGETDIAERIEALETEVP